MGVHDFVRSGRNCARDGDIAPLRPEHVSRARFGVTIWPRAYGNPVVVNPGDLVRWNPTGDVESIRTWTVVTISKVAGCQGAYRAELSALIPDVTVGGVTHAAPSQGALVAI